MSSSLILFINMYPGSSIHAGMAFGFGSKHMASYRYNARPFQLCRVLPQLPHRYMLKALLDAWRDLMNQAWSLCRLDIQSHSSVAT